jgi:hypothetical protein
MQISWCWLLCFSPNTCGGTEFVAESTSDGLVAETEGKVGVEAVVAEDDRGLRTQAPCSSVSRNSISVGMEPAGSTWVIVEQAETDEDDPMERRFGVAGDVLGFERSVARGAPGTWSGRRGSVACIPAGADWENCVEAAPVT